MGKKNRSNKSSVSDDKKIKASSGYAGFPLVITCVFALASGYIYYVHISGMFENDRHFSHLSNLEREIAFRTEMGLYYSYFKTIALAPSLGSGLLAVTRDNVTEYPLTINVLKRFNLYPEVVMGVLFRYYIAVTDSLKIKTKDCWIVNRGKDLSSVPSCEGFGDPMYFYVLTVFALNGFMMSIFFLYGTYLSNSVFGGLLTVVQFFFNQGECARVQWTPPLRESWAYPFFVMQLFLVTYTLRSAPRPTVLHILLIAMATVSFMLPWQFAQFALLTQTLSVFGTYVLGFIDRTHIFRILLGQALGLLVSYVLLFGNEMLLTSFFVSGLITVFCILAAEPAFHLLRFRPLIWSAQILLLFAGMVGVKVLIGSLLRIEDDAHIGDIFRSKFVAGFKTFDTMLYTCATEFDFMEADTPWRVLKTLLLPSVLVVAVVLGWRILRRIFAADVLNQEPELVYHAIQLVGFTVMAIMIMRLKLFWTPFMCLTAALLASRSLFHFVPSRQAHWALIGFLLAGMSVQGYLNIKHQLSIRGEFSNPGMEQLVEWINKSLPQDAVFGGPMPTMATVKLTTGRPIVNHPHYEDAGLRARTKQIYMIYSRKPVEQVHQALVDLKVQYLLVEEPWCFRRSKPGCGMVDIWDEIEPAERDRPPVCPLLFNTPPRNYFHKLYETPAYRVLKVVGV